MSLVLPLAWQKIRFSYPKRFGSAFTAAAEASNTSEGPDEKLEASFRHSPFATQKKGGAQPPEIENVHVKSEKEVKSVKSLDIDV